MSRAVFSSRGLAGEARPVVQIDLKAGMTQVNSLLGASLAHALVQRLKI